MGNGVGTAFTVCAKGTTDSGEPFSEEMTFGAGRPTLRHLKQELEYRLQHLYGSQTWPFRISGMRIERDCGRLELLSDTNQLHDGEVIRISRAGEGRNSRHDSTGLTLKQKAKVVFKHMDTHHKGYIDSTDAKNVLGGGRCSSTRMRIPATTIHDWFLEADTSRTGRINWRAWVRFAQNHASVIDLIYSHIQSWKHHLTLENTVPHYMVSTVADRCRSGQVVVDAVAPVPDYVHHSPPTVYSQRRGYSARHSTSIPPAPPEPFNDRGYDHHLQFDSRPFQQHQFIPPAPPPPPPVDNRQYASMPHDESHLFQHEIRRSPPRFSEYDEYRRP
eukprot:TRINITY_DN24387_c0_g1_i1.p1 TRINITY_DN24387_c0_g1~~TRINITY_DN24387_c0_g1_i1.p1  ORF type:complete len:331 (+),score=33.01 TRINITY_DN24387_c0_g1_i1:48-1040(+)